MYFSQYFNIVALQLFYLSASINPILYNLISKKYRAAASKLLRTRKSPHRVFCSGGHKEDRRRDTANHTETSSNIKTLATTTTQPVTSLHGPGTSEKKKKTGLQGNKHGKGGGDTVKNRECDILQFQQKLCIIISVLKGKNNCKEKETSDNYLGRSSGAQNQKVTQLARTSAILLGYILD